VALLGHAAASYAIAPLTIPSTAPGRIFPFFAQTAHLAGRIVPGIEHALTARTLMGHPDALLALYAIPLLVSTACFIGVLVAVREPRGEADPTLPRRLVWWSVAFAAAALLTNPSLVPDFWLSVAWGRVLAAGANPYFDIPRFSTNGLPLDYPIMHMTYGPLWAWVSAAIMRITGGGAIAGAIVMKLVLATAWIGVVLLVDRLTATKPASERALAIVTIGWLPVSVTQTVGEGHNDVVMIVLVLVWLLQLERGRRALASLALTAATLAKYISAPLFLLDLLHLANPDARPHPSVLARVTHYLPRALIAAVFTTLVLGPLFQSPAFFAATLDVREGHFYLPADAVFALTPTRHRAHPSRRDSPWLPSRAR
jgi:alpha-1,6-mannosyltransferase